MALPVDEAPAGVAKHATDHLAEVFRELAKGEQTAHQLEVNLSKMEQKLDSILAALEARQPDVPAPVQEDEEEHPRTEASAKEN